MLTKFTDYTDHIMLMPRLSFLIPLLQEIVRPVNRVRHPVEVGALLRIPVMVDTTVEVLVMEDPRVALAIVELREMVMDLGTMASTYLVSQILASKRNFLETLETRLSSRLASTLMPMPIFQLRLLVPMFQSLSTNLHLLPSIRTF